ncbi:hypothetical protein BDN72DRAFT_878805 [Pluteus cervinus]|uniref:Uncharacterized protein n=1 Tax=Pluteus cervinus TaxID=181527 RepID=A0ACD3AS37_9AGAR|nr:hypothetical protein BDN72DRAFT_878805 [Pluteus cervinus]
MSKNIILVDGHGKIALRLTRLLAPTHSVTSVIQDKEHEAEVKAAGGAPVHLILATASVSDLTKVFEGKDIVYLLAGCGHKGTEEENKVAYREVPIKVYDAIEAVTGAKPRLIHLSGVDVRDTTKPVPAHYGAADIKMSDQLWKEWIPFYMKYKYEGDTNLNGRTAFKWTALRAAGFADKEGTGKVSVGRTPIAAMISRDDVAKALVALLGREDANGLALDIIEGETPLDEALDAAIKKGETDFLG